MWNRAHFFLTAGHEYFNVFSFETCPAGPGTGPLLGLCASNVSVPLAQILMPPQTPPFHFTSPNTSETFGPFLLPALTGEGVCLDLTGGILQAKSEAIRFIIR